MYNLFCKRCYKPWKGALTHLIFERCLWFFGEKKIDTNRVSKGQVKNDEN